MFGGTVGQPFIGYVVDRSGPVKLDWLCFALVLAGATLLAFAGYGAFSVAGLYSAAILIAASGRGNGGYPVGLLVLVSQSYTLRAIVGPSAETALLVTIGSWALPVLVMTFGGYRYYCCWGGMCCNGRKSEPKQRRAANKWRLYFTLWFGIAPR